jgi:hypothetical protein
MPDGSIEILKPATKATQGLSICDLQTGCKDSIGEKVLAILFRGHDYAIYRSNRGVYVHFSDDVKTERDQRSAYAKLSIQLCELRYLTSQMQSGVLGPLVGRLMRRDSLYQHNMAQALMLLMESVARRASNQADEAISLEQDAKSIAQRALDMAIHRNTLDNTIRYVRTCVFFGIFWLGLAAMFYRFGGNGAQLHYYILASASGVVGAVFSVIVRAQAFELKPCDDSSMNKLMSLIRVGMGGIAGPALLLLLMTFAANPMANGVNVSEPASVGAFGFIRMIAIIGLIGGFAERLVPNLVRGAADKMEGRSGTPGQAVQTASPGPAQQSTTKLKPAELSPAPGILPA